MILFGRCLPALHLPNQMAVKSPLWTTTRRYEIFFKHIHLKKFSCYIVKYKSQVLFRCTATAAAKSLQSCLTLCDPIDGSPPGSPSLGFSRQEHWSGLLFPSPMRESEKWKWNRSVVSDPQWPHGLQPTRLLRPWDFPGKSTGVGCHRLLR